MYFLKIHFLRWINLVRCVKKPTCTQVHTQNAGNSLSVGVNFFFYCNDIFKIIHIPWFCQIHMHTKLALHVRYQQFRNINSYQCSYNTLLTSKLLHCVRNSNYQQLRSEDWHATITLTWHTNLKCDLLLRYCHIHSYRHCMNNLI